ncbi:MAG TPA: tol-pal system protein YbgF [Desulfonatronum sp.]|nr:tol-pal system protein YbgF [Desulfonatronum sp.]
MSERGVNARLWLMAALVCALAGCASGQPWKRAAVEQSVLQLQAEQEQMQDDFDRRMASMEMSLLRQEKFLREYFDVPGRVVADDLPAGPEPGLKDDPDPADAREAPAKQSQTLPEEDEPVAQAEEPGHAQAEPRPQPEPRAKDPGQAFYDQALQKYYRGEYDQARADFTAFAERHPDSPLQANALYWLAETHYAQKEYAQSILVFKELTRRYPASRKTSDALLKAGFAYEQLGDIPNARFHLQLVLDDHPRTAAARLARQRLETLPGS